MKRKATTQKQKKPSLNRSQTIAQQKVFLARRVLSNPDVKTMIIPMNFTGITTISPLIYNIVNPTVIVPGTGQINNYIGSRIKPVSLTARYTWTVGDATNIIRVGFFQVEGSISGASTAGNFYYDTTWPISILNPAPTYPFNTLSDQMFCGTSGAGSDTILGTKKIFVKGNKLLPIVFGTAGATVSSGQIFLVVLSDSSILPNPTLAMYLEMKYLDV